ncbi:family 78 glycoside hydrolase catalytic domain [Mucilaginibacter sp. AW1-3]
MKKISLLTILFLNSFVWACGQVKVEGLLCGNSVNPLGVDAGRIVLNWQITAGKPNVLQSAYRILVADSPTLLSQDLGNIWDSGKTYSSNSVQVAYHGKKLLPAKKYWWKVMIWDKQGIASAWSAIANWQTGLSATADWQGAKWIAYQVMPENKRQVPFISGAVNPRKDTSKDILPLLRKQISIKKDIRQATIFISGLGQFELSLNGEKVGDHFLDPGWTNYDKQALYVTFDITGLLKKGSNAIGVMLGNGFYHIPTERYRKMTGSFGYPKMTCRVLINYTDGTSANIVSDTTWKAAPGPVTFSSIYGGEDHDARLEQSGWDKAGFNDQGWQNAIVTTGPTALAAQLAPALKQFDSFKPVSIKQPKPGVFVYDMGQNASGIPHITITGTRGSKVKITPAELIVDSSGTVNQRPSGAPSYFVYTLKGDGIENWQPQFMYYGFRYLQVEGAVPAGQPNPNGLPVVSDLTEIHTRNSAKTMGDFTCSNPLFNQIYKLIDWSVKSNMASVLTDCPHREKLGWLEVPALLGNSLRYNYDIENFYRKIVQDMSLSQKADGLVPNIAPEYVEFTPDFRDSPEWGSSSIILPWSLYQWYGDKSVLAENYDMMKRYAGYLGSRAKDHIVSHGLGEWFDIGPKGSGEGYSVNTPQGITGTATYYYDVTILEQTAVLLGKTDDAKEYRELAAQIRIAFNKTFFDASKMQYGTGSQAANAMAIYMKLVEPQYKDAVLANLVKDIKNHNNNLTTGEVGYKYLLSVLEAEGRSDLIFEMNNRSDVPGYGYQLAHGATTLMEDWQANKALGNNHCMLGHLLGWFYSGLGGIRQAENSVAFDQIIIHPEVVGDITHCKASHLSPHGWIKTEWTKDAESFKLAIEIPANTTATIEFNWQNGASLLRNGQLIDPDKIIRIGDKQYASVKTGSGKYNFVLSR